MHKGIEHDLATIPPDDPPTYAMIRKADTLGVFQIESRAQMAMLPRLQAREPSTTWSSRWRSSAPGPIQGDMVHPYLRRREGIGAGRLSEARAEGGAGQDAGRAAVPGAGDAASPSNAPASPPSEADQLRRAMATFKFTGTIGNFRDELIEGMVASGYDQDLAERIFKQLEGFGSYGFPESHAASFALLAYASSWLKCHHPEVFCAALLNSQPMGFYAPAQIVRDAREHGVEVRPV